MGKKFLTPVEITNATINTSITKANLKLNQCMLLGILAGMFIGFGAFGNIVFTQTLASIDIGLAKFAGAVVFPVGLILVVVCGAELFTGNNLMTLAVLDKKISLKKMFRNWGLVYLANLIGSLLLVALIYESGLLVEDGAIKAIYIAESKATLSIYQAFFRGVLCNILVVLAVWMATASQDIISKLFACWFPIMLFVLCGFEHSVANMFFIPMGMVLGADVSVIQFIANLMVVTIGNIVGGAIVIPFIYHKVYLKSN